MATTQDDDDNDDDKDNDDIPITIPYIFTWLKKHLNISDLIHHIDFSDSQVKYLRI
jgi:hypothetical protein